MGYHRAGFEVVGVDIKPQPRYPFEFHQFEALAFLRAFLDIGPWPNDEIVDMLDVSAIHASPPCQAYTHAKHMGNRGRDDHPDLLAPTRNLLEQTGLPYVIENVPDSPMFEPVVLCGSSAGLPDLERHRWFETNWPLMVPPCAHGVRGAARFPGTPRANGSKPDSRIVNLMASGTSHEMLAQAMDIDWMPPSGRRPTQELRNAIPPAYTEFIGTQLMAHLKATVAERMPISHMTDTGDDWSGKFE